MRKKKGKRRNDTAEILEIVNFIKDRMLTRDEGVTKAHMLRSEECLFAIKQELKDIKRLLIVLERTLDGVEKYTDDIKEFRARVAALEKQLASKR